VLLWVRLLLDKVEADPKFFPDHRRQGGHSEYAPPGLVVTASAASKPRPVRMGLHSVRPCRAPLFSCGDPSTGHPRSHERHIGFRATLLSAARGVEPVLRQRQRGFGRRLARGVLSGGLGITVLVGVLAQASSPASAATAVPASEGVRCSFSGQVTFTPPLTASRSPRVSRIQATLSGCLAQRANPQSARVIGLFAQSPLDCTTLSSTDAPLDARVHWKVPRTKPPTRPLQKTTILDGATTGSFPGVADLALTVPSNLAADCASGVKRLAVSGTLLIGPSCGHVGNPVSIFALTGSYCDTFVDGPQNIVAGPDGALWFENRFTGFIGRITTSGTLTTFPDPVPEVFGGPVLRGPLVVGPDGSLWFTNTATSDGPNTCVAGSIGRMTTSGNVTLFTDPNLVPGTDLIFGPDGALWFDNGGCNGVPPSIGRMTTAGSVTIYTGPGLDNPGDLTVGPDGALWFVNSGHLDSSTGLYLDQSIGRITTAGVVSSYTDPNIYEPGSLVVAFPPSAGHMVMRLEDDGVRSVAPTR
jgi:hypothetical protein